MRKNFICPKCSEKIPFWKTFILTNFTKHKCKNCASILSPNRETMEKIAGTGIAILLPIILVLTKTLGIVYGFIALLVGYIIVSFITYRITIFEVDKGDQRRK